MQGLRPYPRETKNFLDVIKENDIQKIVLFPVGYQKFKIFSFIFEKLMKIKNEMFFEIRRVRQNFHFLWVQAKPLHFYLEKVVFLEFFFFFTKDLILLVHLNLFLQYFLYIFEKESFPSRF